MNKDLLSILLFVSSFSTFAQNYKFVEPGKQWFFSRSSAFEAPYDYSSTMSTDSFLINGKYFFKSSQVREGGKPMQVFFWREENGKVYRRRSGSTLEELVYDWRLEKGDTLYNLSFGQGFSVVDSVGMITVDPSKGRKIWYLSLFCFDDHYGNFSVIEGIGATEEEFADGRCYVFESSSILQGVVKDKAMQYSTFHNCGSSDFTEITHPFKQWVCFRKNVGSSTAIYTRYQFRKFGLDPGKQELFSTSDQQADNNWKSTNKIFDENQGKIFEYIDSKPYILFDFSLIKGDTFFLEFPNEPTVALLVDSTDKVVLLDNREYKRLYLSCPTALDVKLTWVEGIGEINHFYQYRHLCYNKLDFDLNLTCYYYNFNLYYHSINATLCNLKSAIEDQPHPTTTYAVPNPTTGFFTIKIEKPIKYTIRSLGGIVCQKGSVLPDEKINISDLISGMYVLSAVDDDGRLLSHIKLIKQ